MADIEGRPFLEYVLEYLRHTGVGEVILSVGYKAEVIERHFGNGSSFGIGIRCLHEQEPLGTAGALRLALPFIGNRAFVLNGDTYVDVDLLELLDLHLRADAAVTLAAVEQENASRFGRLVVADDQLRSFEEKLPDASPGLINAGVYLFERRSIERIAPDRPSSLERDLLPALIEAGETVAVHRHTGYFEDIGVPESLSAFRSRIRAGRAS